MKAWIQKPECCSNVMGQSMVAIVEADCTGCGDDGHQVCPIEKKHKHVTYMKEEHKESSSEPENGVVFAVCIFEIAEDGTRKLVDHVASENLMNCLKNMSCQTQMT